MKNKGLIEKELQDINYNFLETMYMYFGIDLYQMENWYTLDWKDFKKRILKSESNIKNFKEAEWKDFFLIQKKKIQMLQQQNVLQNIA